MVFPTFLLSLSLSLLLLLTACFLLFLFLFFFSFFGVQHSFPEIVTVSIIYSLRRRK